MNKLVQRVVTALILVAVLLVVFFRLPPAAAVILIGTFIVAGAWEWAAFAGWASAVGRLAYAGFMLALLLAIAGLRARGLPTAWIVWVGLAWWCCAFLLVLRYPVRVGPWATGLCGLLIMLPVWVASLAILGSDSGGPGMLLYALAMVWAADVGAYFTGRRIGRVRLAPRVSPGKTWEGVIGGLVAAVAVAAAGAVALGLTPRAAAALAVPLGLSLALVSVLGDLTVSMFKRNAGLKDSGSLFPGHGGVLDRVDGVCVALPLYAALLHQTGLVDL
jgi:phosphatidate cytidylyltransferase